MRSTRSNLPMILALTFPPASAALAAPVPLQNATATFSQTSFGGNPVSFAIDGNFASNNAWAVYEGPTDGSGSIPNNTNPQTAVFETVSNLNVLDGPTLTFSLHHLFSAPSHTLGRFRISATADARTTFADGLPTGGDVTATWTVLTPLTAVSTNGATLSILGDGSVLASGTSPTNAVYTLTALNTLNGITGFRLEALADASLPDSGPGRSPGNGNFALTEFEVQATPEPTTLALLAVAPALAAHRRRRGA